MADEYILTEPGDLILDHEEVKRNWTLSAAHRLGSFLRVPPQANLPVTHTQALVGAFKGGLQGAPPPAPNLEGAYAEFVCHGAPERAAGGPVNSASPIFKQRRSPLLAVAALQPAS